MSILVYHDPEMVGTCAATLFASHLLSEPRSVVGVDYHETLLPTFRDLSEMTELGLLNWKDAHIFQLFEFLPETDGTQRIANLLGKALFAKTGITEQQYTVPFSRDLPAADAAEAFERTILDHGGLDAVLIAVRQDGSLLMNTSADALPETHSAEIDGDGFITTGIAALMQAKHPIVVATGKALAESVRDMLKGNLTGSPLAALRLHPGATFILDEEAAELL